LAAKVDNILFNKI